MLSATLPDMADSKHENQFSKKDCSQPLSITVKRVLEKDEKKKKINKNMITHVLIKVVIENCLGICEEHDIVNGVLFLPCQV